MTESPSYRLDELGWLQFDRLCSLVLEAEAGLSDLRWHGRGDIARVATVDGGLSLGKHGVTLGGPVAVAVIWVRASPVTDLPREEFRDRVVALRADEATWLLVTNLEAAEAEAALRIASFAHERRVIVLGAGEISASLDRDPRLRAAMPSVLGLRDLAGLIEPAVIRCSTLDVDRAQELARVFWPTRAYELAREVLERHRFVVLAGPPEMGKTAIAEMLALAKMTDGREAHQCNDPEQVWPVFDRARRQAGLDVEHHPAA